MSCLRGVSRWFTPLGCGPGHPELSKSYMDMASKLFTFTFTCTWIIVSFARVYRVGVWFGFVRSALLLAVVLCWVDSRFGSWLLLGLLCFLRVTQEMAHAKAAKNQP